MSEFFNRNSSTAPVAGPTAAAPSDPAATEATDGIGTEEPTAAAGKTEPAATDPVDNLPDDPKKALDELVKVDKKAVVDDLSGQWVPQISSKKKGLKAEGKTWTEQDILDEHLHLREEYPRVRLVWSGDFASFKEGNFWVTIAGIGYNDPEGALSWCSQQGLGADHCYAKQLNTSGGTEGTTRLQD